MTRTTMRPIPLIAAASGYLRRDPFRLRVLLVLLAGQILIVGLVAVVWLALASGFDSAGVVRELLDEQILTRAQVSKINSTIRAAEIGHRDYVLTGSARALASHAEAKTALPERIEALGETVAAHAALRGRLEKLANRRLQLMEE